MSINKKGFTVQADLFITARRSVIVIDKEHHECQIIDFAIPYDTRADDKEVEKIKNQLAKELKKVPNSKVTVVLLVSGALVTPGEVLEKRFMTIAIEAKITEL